LQIDDSHGTGCVTESDYLKVQLKTTGVAVIATLSFGVLLKIKKGHFSVTSKTDKDNGSVPIHFAPWYKGRNSTDNSKRHL
jgi:hypothetical protein